VNKVPGFGAPQGAIFFFVSLQKKSKQFRVIFQPVGFDHLTENGPVSFPGRWGDIKPIPHPAQKGLIHQALEIRVGGKNELLLERDLDLLARLQGQVIRAPFQGDDPVERIF